MKIKPVCLLLFLLLACSPSGELTLMNVNDLATLNSGNLLYSLPLSRVLVEITAVRHLTIPGPYNAFAEKYMGYKNIVSISKTDWELNNIKVSVFEEPDPEYCFSLSTARPERVKDQLDQLSAEGLIISAADYYSFSQFFPFFGDKPEPFYFPDISVKPMIEKDIRKTAPKGDQGSTSGGYHYNRNDGDIKSLEEKAEEAAAFIYKLRKRRFKLLVGQEQPVPDGNALDISIRELDELEKEYLSLFIGKTYSDTLKRCFVYTPKATQDIERNVICRFSDETGIQDENASAGTPLVLELRNMKYTEAIKSIKLNYKGTSVSNTLIYRIPDKAKAYIFYGSSVMEAGELRIFQYGSLFQTDLENHD